MSKVVLTREPIYISSHVVIELFETGFEVVIVDNLSDSYTGSIDGVERVTGNKRYFQLLNRIQSKKP